MGVLEEGSHVYARTSQILFSAGSEQLREVRTGGLPARHRVEGAAGGQAVAVEGMGRLYRRAAQTGELLAAGGKIPASTGV